MASYPKSSNPYAKKKEEQGFSSYDAKTGTLQSGSLKYSVAPEKSGALLGQVEDKNKWILTSKSKNKSKSTSELADNSSSSQVPEEKPLPEVSSNGNNKPSDNNKKSSFSTSSSQDLQRAYLQSQAQQRTPRGEETLAPKPNTQMLYPDTRGRVESYNPTFEEKLNANRAEAQRAFRERVAGFSKEGLKTAGTLVLYKTGSRLYGAGKGAINFGVQAKNTITLQENNLISNSFNFATDVVSNPKGTAKQIISDYKTNPDAFISEQATFGVLGGKTTSVLKTGLNRGDILNPREIVKPINVEGAFTRIGSLAEKGQRAYSNVLKGKDYVAGLVVEGANKVYEYNQELGKQGKARLSKAEIRLKSRTGYTKAERIKQPNPSQEGKQTQTFYNRDIVRNQELQSRIANTPYKELSDNAKKYKLVSKPAQTKLVDTKLESGMPVYKEVSTPRVDEIFRAIPKIKKNKGDAYTPKQQGKGTGVQTTTKNLGFSSNNVNLNSDGTITLTRGKLKVKYEYPKKPTLKEQKPEPKKRTPFNKAQDLLANVNERGQEVFTPASEPVPVQVVKGFRSAKIREEIIERVKKKREAQLAEIEKRKTTPKYSSQYPVVVKQYSMKNVNPEVVYQPKVSPEQLARTRTYTRELPATAPRIELGYKKGITPAKPIGYEYKNPYLVLQQQKPQLESPTLILGQSNQFTGQITNVVGEKVNSQEEQKPEPVFPEPEPVPPQPKPRSRRRSVVPPPPSPVPVERAPVFTPISTPTAPRRFAPVVSQPTKPIKPIVPSFKKPTERVVSRSGGFDVLVRKRGKFIKINKGALSRGEALNLGAYRVGTTSSATFKLSPSKSSATERFTGRGIFSDFYTKGDLFIEKKSRRIKSQGELSEITYKGIASQKYKKIF